MFRRLNIRSILLTVGLNIVLILTIQHFNKIDKKNVPKTKKININDVENIIHTTRLKIKQEMSQFDFSYSGVRELEDLLKESGGRPIQNLILSSWRSGTTFFGQLLEAIPGTFYNYEPLLKYGIVQIREPPESIRAVREVKEMFKCNFSGLHDYFKFAKTDLLQFKNSKWLWSHCQNNLDLCFDADFTSRFCQLFPIQTMKICRLRLRLVQDILDDQEINVKAMLLIRDPRGVMNSRRHRRFCRRGLDCWQPELLCADMVRDYRAARQLLPQYSDRLLVLRLEDLIREPIIVTRRILSFLRINAQKEVDEFLQKHMTKEEPTLNSTYRISREVPYRWKKGLDFNYVDELQMVCKEAMELWGYRIAYNATHMISEEFEPVGKYNLTY